MKYLEKYAFYYMPDFSNMDDVYADFYNKLDLTQVEIEYINKEIKKDYIFYNQ
jgi:hypothetical protein